MAGIEPALARAVADAVRARIPSARSLLQVGCGNGTLLGCLAGEFEHVEGVEPDPVSRQAACGRLPAIAVHGGDPRTFDLRLVFDVVLCTGTVVASGRTDVLFERLTAHLADGGVLVTTRGSTVELSIPGEARRATDDDDEHRHLSGIAE